jgi:hypothetical protein
VRKLFLFMLWWRRREGGRGGDGRIHNQNQEPHTKMWGKMMVLDFVLVLSEGHTQLNAFI